MDSDFAITINSPDLKVIDPGVNVEDIMDSRQTMLRKIQTNNEKIEKEKVLKNIIESDTKKVPLWKAFLMSQLGLAILTFLIVLAICYIANPPLTKNRSGDIKKSQQQNFGFVLIFCFIAMALVYFGPYVVSFTENFIKKQNKKD